VEVRGTDEEPVIGIVFRRDDEDGLFGLTYPVEPFDEDIPDLYIGVHLDEDLATRDFPAASRTILDRVTWLSWGLEQSGDSERSILGAIKISERKLEGAELLVALHEADRRSLLPPEAAELLQSMTAEGAATQTIIDEVYRVLHRIYGDEGTHQGDFTPPES
jgi:hypothetical protein